MTSESIYAAGQHPSFYENLPHTGINAAGKPYTPYVYMISWKDPEMHYIGAAYRKYCHPYKFWNRHDEKNSYFTSSKYVKDYIAIHGDPDAIKILHVCDTMEEVKNIESQLLNENNAASNEKFLNKSNGDGKYVYDNHGKVVAYALSDVDMKHGMHMSVDEYMKNRDKYFRPTNNKSSYIDLETGDQVFIENTIVKSCPDRYRHIHAEEITVKNKVTGKSVRITTSEFKENRNLYEFHAEGMATVKVIATGEITTVPTEEYQANKGVLYESIMTGTLIVFSIETQEWVQVDSEFYQQNKHLFKTQIDFGFTVTEISTGNKIRITHEEYHKNKHLYATAATNRVNVTVKATGEGTSIDRDEFLKNRHLYTTQAEGKESHKKGKKSYVNAAGDCKFFTEDSVPDGWELSKVLYSIDNDEAKMLPVRLLTEQPDKFFTATIRFDKIKKTVSCLPKIIYSSDPSRYFSLKSQEYKDFKESQR